MLYLEGVDFILGVFSWCVVDWWLVGGGGWCEKVGEWEGGGEKGNCTKIPANMAEEEVVKLIVGNDSSMCKASFAG